MSSLAQWIANSDLSVVGVLAAQNAVVEFVRECATSRGNQCMEVLLVVKFPRRSLAMSKLARLIASLVTGLNGSRVPKRAMEDPGSVSRM
jgi:hypothetical protein